MTDQVNTLSVRAILASDDYVRGAAAVATSNKEMARSAAEAGVAITTIEVKAGSAGGGLGRLTRAYDSAGASSSKFQTDIRTLNTLLETGKVTTEQAGAIYLGMTQKLGMVADAAHIAAQGFGPLSTVISGVNDNVARHKVQVDALAASYRELAAEARAAQSADNAQSRFNQSFGIAQPVGYSAASSGAFFEEELRKQDEIERRLKEINQLRAQQAGQNFQTQTNSLLGVGGFGTDARASAAVFEEAARETEMFAQKAEALRAVIDPVAASQSRLNKELAEYSSLMDRGVINAQEFAQAEALAKARHDQFAASMNGASGGFDANSQFRRQNLGYQAFDIGQGLASGMPLGMIAAQQGPQIAQNYIGQGGFKALFTDVAAMAGGAAAAIGPIGLAFAAAAAAGTALFFSVRRESKTTDQVLQEHAANIKALGDAYGISTEKARAYSEADKAIAEAATRTSSTELLQKQKEAIEALSLTFGRMGGPARGQIGFQMMGGFEEFGKAFKDLRATGDIEKFAETIKRIGAENGMQKQADQILNVAKQSAALNSELEKTQRILRDIFSDKGPGGFLLSQGPTNRTDSGNLALFESQQKVAAERAQQTYDAQIAGIMARSPQEKADAARMSAAAQYNDNETPAARAKRIELAGTQALTAAEHDLAMAQQDRQRQAQASLAQAEYEVSLIGKTVEERNRLMAAFQAEQQIREAAARANVQADEQEIASARTKAAAVADLNAKISAGKLLEDQGNQIEQLRLEAQLVGATASERARATAALQAEQQLRQQGINILSQEGQAYRDNAVAMAEARVQIERSQAAYASYQQAGSSAIDALTASTGSLQDRLKGAADAMLSWITQLALANPLKNAMFGTNLPTLADLGKPQVPAGLTPTSTASMMVTAGTVMINGGVMGGQFPSIPGSTLPGTSTAGGLMDVIKGTTPSAANQNLGPFSSSVDAVNAARSAATAPAGSIEAYIRQRAPVYGVDPDTAVAVARSEGGLQSWNRQSDVINAAGVREQSYGPYQLYMGGGLGNRFQQQTGLDPRLAENGPAATDYALQTASKEGWGAWYGARKAGISDWQGINRNPGIDSTTTNSITDSSAALKQLSTNTTIAAKDVSTLGSNSQTAGQTLMDVLGGNKPAGGGFPAAPALPTNSPNYFPPAPAAPGGGNIFSMLFGWIPKLFGFADGTEHSPGGWAMVGERGPEIVNLPRGSQVIPNHKSFPNSEERMRSGGRMKVDVGVSVDRNGNLEAYVKSIAEDTSEQYTRAGISAYDAALPDRLEEHARNPSFRSAA